MADETRRLARHVGELRRVLEDPGVRTMAEEAVLDWVACTVAGAGDPRIAPLYRMLEPLPAPGHSWVAGSGASHALRAAFLNGASSHVLELDDIERTAYIHPGIAPIAAAMALADNDERLETERFLRAVVAGYEVSVRVGRSVNPSHYEIWHTTGTAGAIGAAVAASVILGLDEEKTTWAMGNAGTEAAGLWQFNADGALTKPYHVGMAALHGVMAALAAREGFSGPHRILEGDQGFLRAMSRDPRPRDLVESLGEVPPAIMGISRKRWASCRFTHPAVDAVMAVREPERSREVESIDIDTFHTAIRVAGHPDPRTTQEAKFSIRYCAALAWVTGDVGIDAFEDVPSGSLEPIFQRIRVREREGYNALLPQLMPARVAVTWKDGTQTSCEILHPQGDPENPIVGDVLDTKIRFMLGAIVPGERLDRAIKVARSSEAFPSYHDWIRGVRGQ